MTENELNDVLHYATSMAVRAGRNSPWLRDELVDAARFGVAAGLRSPRLPADIVKRKRFLARTAYNWVLKEFDAYKGSPSQLRGDRAAAVRHRVDEADLYRSYRRLFDGFERIVFDAIFGEGRQTYEQIGERTGYSKPMVKLVVSRVRAKVRRRAQMEGIIDG